MRTEAQVLAGERGGQLLDEVAHDHAVRAMVRVDLRNDHAGQAWQADRSWPLGFLAIQSDDWLC